MTLLLHLAYIVVLDFLFFEYWFVFANRYTVLNYHETAFLPGRYIIAGLVAGVFIYWLYLLPLAVFKHFRKRYQQPRWWLLWIAVAFISSLNTFSILRGRSTPPLELYPSIALIVHLQVMHLIMLLVADRALRRKVGSILPGVRSAVILMGLWLFWIWYSFEVEIVGEPRPLVGSEWERGILAGILATLILVGLWFRIGRDEGDVIKRSDWVFKPLDITVADVLDAFYSAWALFYLVMPVLQYLARGYVMAYSNLFPAFLLGLLLPTLWSLVGMVLIILVSKPALPKNLWEHFRSPAEVRSDSTEMP